MRFTGFYGQCGFVFPNKHAGVVYANRCALVKVVIGQVHVNIYVLIYGYCLQQL